VEIAIDVQAPLARPSGELLERVCLPAGTRLEAEVRPYVVETVREPTEMADLVLANGTAVLGVPFACFTFID
jgi:hypothetical protein